jgi:hypothetical protein
MIITKVENVDDYYYDVFLSISAAITGFQINELQATGMGLTYYRHVLDHTEEATFIAFLNVSREILETTFSTDQMNNAIAAQLVAAPAMNDIFTKVVTMWYLGTWNGAYVNDLSYTQGLVWTIIPAHPPGAKQPGFKSWSVPPVNAEI